MTACPNLIFSCSSAMSALWVPPFGRLHGTHGRIEAGATIPLRVVVCIEDSFPLHRVHA